MPDASTTGKPAPFNLIASDEFADLVAKMQPRDCPDEIRMSSPTYEYMKKYLGRQTAIVENNGMKTLFYPNGMKVTIDENIAPGCYIPYREGKAWVDPDVNN